MRSARHYSESGGWGGDPLSSLAFGSAHVGFVPTFSPRTGRRGRSRASAFDSCERETVQQRGQGAGRHAAAAPRPLTVPWSVCSPESRKPDEGASCAFVVIVSPGIVEACTARSPSRGLWSAAGPRSGWRPVWPGCVSWSFASRGRSAWCWGRWFWETPRPRTAPEGSWRPSAAGGRKT